VKIESPKKDPVDRETHVEKVREKKKKIIEVTEEAQQASIGNYAEEFNEKAEKEVVVLAEVGVEELNQEQDKIEQEKKQKIAKELAQYQQQVSELKHLLAESEDQLCHRKGLVESQIRRTEIASIMKAQREGAAIGGAFSVAHSTLKTYLDDSKKQVEIIYKDVKMDYTELRHNLTGQEKQASGQSWRSTPQLIEIHISCMRCVKDKLPKGRYAVLCSVMERLGGNTLEMQKKNSKKWRRVTSPKPHSGEYHLNNLVFNQSLLLFVPPRSEVKPSMAILFELFLLKSKDFSHDQVLGWGVFPLIDSDFELNNGKFKVWLDLM